MKGVGAQISGRGFPDKPAITIKLRVRNYFVSDVWFDPAPAGQSQPVPEGLADGATGSQVAGRLHFRRSTPY